VLVDRNQHFSGVVTLKSLDRARRDGQGLAEARLSDVAPLRAEQALSDVLTDVARAPTPLPVVDGDGGYVGTVSRAVLLEALAGLDEQEEHAA
jgi:glycine betaine/proline transport system ATP-binding protein